MVSVRLFMIWISLNFLFTVWISLEISICYFCFQRFFRNLTSLTHSPPRWATQATCWYIGVIFKVGSLCNYFSQSHWNNKALTSLFFSSSHGKVACLYLSMSVGSRMFFFTPIKKWVTWKQRTNFQFISASNELRYHFLGDLVVAAVFALPRDCPLIIQRSALVRVDGFQAHETHAELLVRKRLPTLKLNSIDLDVIWMMWRSFDCEIEIILDGLNAAK